MRLRYVLSVSAAVALVGASALLPAQADEPAARLGSSTQVRVGAPTGLAPLRSAPLPPPLLSGLAGLANPLFSLPPAVLPQLRKR